MINHFVFTKDTANKRLLVERSFNAPLAKVWAAWTESELLDQWWAPKPWKAETKTMNFVPGGLWLYSMVNPEGIRHWSRADFKTVNPKTSFSYAATFCDEDGNINANFGASHWMLVFTETATGTMVNVELSFETEAALEKLVAMGFEGGFTMGLGNLDELLAK